MLRGLGLRKVDEATDGVEALEMMRHQAYGLVLLDWAMQPLDGIEFAKLLRLSNDSPNPYSTIIMISGHASRARVLQARDAGVNSFLTKPVSAQGLSDHLHAAFRDGRPYVRSPHYAGPDRRRIDDPGYRGPLRRSSDDADGVAELADDDWNAETKRKS